MSTPPPDDPRVVAEFELRVGERTMQAKARLPAGQVRLVDLLPVLRKFNDAVVSVAVEDARQAGGCVSCRAGCGACCRQIVPISEAEAIALLEWFDTLPAEQQRLIRDRFHAAISGLEQKGMLERTRQAPSVREKNETLRFALDYFHAGVACPFLVNESCGIYPIRPMKCREYLVTSPAENCRTPTAETINMVELPTTFSKHLFHFGRDPAAEGPKWLPLVLLFEWGDAHRAEPQRTDEGIQLFREFLGAFVDSTPEELDRFFTPGADALSGGEKLSRAPTPDAGTERTLGT